MERPVKRVALRLQGWTAWHLQLMRGVQAYAHAAPHWRLHVDGGLREASRVEAGVTRWDGIITSMIHADGIWPKLLRDPTVKVVCVSSTLPPRMHVPVVRVDEALVAAAVGDHLRAGGFRRIAYFGRGGGGRQDHRGAAVAAFAAAHGLPFHAFASKKPAWNWNASFPMNDAVRWLRGVPKPLGIIVWNMAAAPFVIEACHRAGVGVPTDAAVVAADDDPNIAETCEPTISGVVMPADRVAYRAAELLEALMAGGPPPEGPIVIAPSRIIRIRGSSDVQTLPDREVHLAVQYIREHADQALKVPQLAHAVGVSRSRLQAQFLRVLGHSPHEELVRAHLTRAMQLLVETSWTMERIAAASGFGTGRSLHRVFLERHGTTPAMYRERFRVADAARS